MLNILGLMIAAAAWPLVAQTQIDLRSQSKNVDFSVANSTRPLKIGTELPSSCIVGEMFFKTDALAGQNVYGCVNANTWEMEAGPVGQGVVTVQNDSVPVGTREVQNFVPGAGFVYTMTDTGDRINIQQHIDTAVIQTRANAQSGASLLCASASGSGSAYTCSMNPTLSTYTTGMVLYWRPDVGVSGGPVTLDVDLLGANSVKLAPGGGDPSSADVVAGNLYPLWYDGTCFRLMITPMKAGVPSAMRPECSAIERGRIWHTFAADGVKDDIAVCAKDEFDEFGWRALY